MPDVVKNRIVFKRVSIEKKFEILDFIIDKKCRVDFNILIPQPLNIWLGNCGALEERIFKQTWYNWNQANWGTKWNAYNTRHIMYSRGVLELTFDTAWTPPYPWLAALINKLKTSFNHYYSLESDKVFIGKFSYKKEDEDTIKNPYSWSEVECSEKELNLLKKL